jgi:hypothetical protein
MGRGTHHRRYQASSVLRTSPPRLVWERSVTLRIPLSHATARKGWRQRHAAILSPGKVGKGRTLFARMEQAMRR